MRFVKLLVLSFYLVSCTRCVTTSPTPPPIDDAFEDFEPAPQEPLAIKFTKKETAVKINPAKFPGCVGYQVSFKGVLYGLFMAEDVIILPLPTVNEPSRLDIVCTDKESKPGAKRSWDVTRLN